MSIQSNDRIDVIKENEATKVKQTTSKKYFTIFGVQFVHLYFIGIIVALIGWLAENSARAVTQGIIDSRFHVLPFISPYALIPFAFEIGLGDPNSLRFFGHKLFKKETTKTKIFSNIFSFLFISFLVFFGELAVGNLTELFTGVKLWNYSNMPLHVTQYAGLIPSLGYGVMAYILFLLYKPFLKLVQKIPHQTAFLICVTLGVAIVLDTTSMVLQNIITGKPPVYWSINLLA